MNGSIMTVLASVNHDQVRRPYAIPARIQYPIDAGNGLATPGNKRNLVPNNSIAENKRLNVYIYTYIHTYIHTCKYSSDSSRNKSATPLFPSFWCTKVKVTNCTSQPLSCLSLVYIYILFKSHEMFVLNVISGENKGSDY